MGYNYEIVVQPGSYNQALRTVTFLYEKEV